MRGYFNLIWIALFCAATTLVVSLYYQHVALGKEAEKLLMLQNEYRQKTENSSLIADFSLTKGYKSNTNNKEIGRAHV